VHLDLYPDANRAVPRRQKHNTTILLAPGAVDGESETLSCAPALEKQEPRPARRAELLLGYATVPEQVQSSHR
jgi:hypothetical protein